MLKKLNIPVKETKENLWKHVTNNYPKQLFINIHILCIIITKAWLGFIIEYVHATTNLQWFSFFIWNLIVKYLTEYLNGSFNVCLLLFRIFLDCVFFKIICKEFFVQWTRQTRKMTVCLMSSFDYFSFFLTWQLMMLFFGSFSLNSLHQCFSIDGLRPTFGSPKPVL